MNPHDNDNNQRGSGSTRRPFPFFLSLFSLLCLFLSSGCVTEDEPRNEGVGPGDMLPQFSVTLDNGETLSPASLKGKKAVIEFFNTSCPDCREALPAVNALYEAVRDNPSVVVFAISREEDSGAVGEYWSENGFSLPYSAQTDRTVYNLFATTGIPRTYVADETGRITAAYGDSSLPTLSDLLRDLGI